jgi:cardiolipin synthase A/B
MSDNWRDNNDIKLLINGETFFPRVFECIRNACSEVLLETFILAEDKVGHELQEALIVAAKRGVKVDVTVDDYGTFDLSKDFVDKLINAGVRLHIFDPQPTFRGVRFNFFRRLHRKLVVVDNEVAFVGGINISEDHITTTGPKAKQDYAVEVRGPIVSDIRTSCLDLLIQASNKEDALLYKQYAKSSAQKAAGETRILLSIRDNQEHSKDIQRQYLLAIRLAKKRIVIANAYFFPSYRLLREMRRAARRGVEVTLILQGQPDMPWVSALSSLFYSYLMRAGVKIHEYCKRPLHGKVALVDDDWSTVGSSNLDPLSLSLNLEANLIIQDAAFNQQLYEHFQKLSTAECTPVNIKVATHGYWWRTPLIFISFHFMRIFPGKIGWLPAHNPELRLVSSSKRTYGERSFNIKSTLSKEENSTLNALRD